MQATHRTYGGRAPWAELVGVRVKLRERDRVYAGPAADALSEVALLEAMEAEHNRLKEENEKTQQELTALKAANLKHRKELEEQALMAASSASVAGALLLGKVT